VKKTRKIHINNEDAYESVIVPNYFITKTGRVYSIYIIGGRGAVDINKPHELKYGVDKYGYLRVVLSLNSEKTYIKVHQLVVEQFIGHVENGLVINHKDGNKKNNNIENLEITTVKENAIHAHENHLTSRECEVKVSHAGITEEFHSITECLRKIPDLSKWYLDQIRNNIIIFSMIDFKKDRPKDNRSTISAYYNGKFYKKFNSMKEAGLYFGKSKGSVSAAISNSYYRKKINQYHIEFPSVSTIENTI